MLRAIKIRVRLMIIESSFFFTNTFFGKVFHIFVVVVLATYQLVEIFVCLWKSLHHKLHIKYEQKTPNNTEKKIGKFMCFSQCARFGHVLSRNVFSSTAESQMQIDHHMYFLICFIVFQAYKWRKKMCRK